MTPPTASARAARSRPLSVLLVVAHPDDDAIFAGALQRRAARHTWTVVCMTHAEGSPRAQELRAWQASLGTDPARVRFLGHPDDPEDRRQGRCSIDPAAVVRGLRALRARPALLVTHNAAGEYGHPHHVLVHRAALEAYPRVPRLLFGQGLASADLELPCDDAKWSAVAAAYPSQASVVATFARPAEAFVAEPRAATLALVTTRLLAPRDAYLFTKSGAHGRGGSSGWASGGGPAGASRTSPGPSS